MKMRMCGLALVISMALVGGARADAVDPNFARCKLIGGDAQRASFVLGWLQGATRGQSSDPVMRLDRVESSSARLAEFCKGSPERSLHDALEDVLSIQ
jgi:hypothetical protein